MLSYIDGFHFAGKEAGGGGGGGKSQPLLADPRYTSGPTPYGKIIVYKYLIVAHKLSLS